jgi:hypothetical protein
LLQVSEQVALFGGEVAVTATIDFALAGKRRHFAQSAHGIQHFTARRSGRTLHFAVGGVGCGWLDCARRPGETKSYRDRLWVGTRGPIRIGRPVG